MSTERFPKTQIWKNCETEERFRGASFHVPDNQRAKYVRLTLFIKAATSGSFRVGLYTDRDLTRQYALSDAVDITEVIEATGHGAMRRVVVTFGFPEPLPRLEAGVTYHLGVQADGYTRDGLDEYAAFCLDWPLPINQNVGEAQGLAFELFGYRRVRWEA